MNNNKDSNPSFIQSLIYTHDLKCELTYTTHVLTCPNKETFEYMIKDKDHILPALLVKYDTTFEIMEIISFKNKARCKLNIPEEYLKYKIDKMTIQDFLQRLIEFEVMITDQITVNFKNDILWNFNIAEIHEKRDLFDIVLVVRYAAVKSKDIY